MIRDFWRLTVPDCASKRPEQINCGNLFQVRRRGAAGSEDELDSSENLDFWPAGPTGGCGTLNLSEVDLVEYDYKTYQ
eukprot:g32558.t1